MSIVRLNTASNDARFAEVMAEMHVIASKLDHIPTYSALIGTVASATAIGLPEIAKPAPCCSTLSVERRRTKPAI